MNEKSQRDDDKTWSPGHKFALPKRGYGRGGVILEDAIKDDETEQTGPRSIISKYRHEDQNSIYHLDALSKSVYFFNFNTNNFSKEELKTKVEIPMKASTAQRSDGRIFVIGG